MACKTKIPTHNIKTTEGHSYSAEIRVGTEPFVRKAIQSITFPNGTPIIACTGHGLLSGWPVSVAGAKGFTDLNPTDPNNIDGEEQYQATVLDANTIELNSYNAAGAKAHTPNTGVIQYNTPLSLTGRTHRMRLRDRKGGKLLVCTAPGTTGSTKPTGAGQDGSVVWAAGIPSANEKVWVSGMSVSLGDTIDLSVLASSDAEDKPYNVITLVSDTALQTLTVTLPPAATALLSGKTGYYDIESTLTATGEVKGVIEGVVEVSKE